MAGIVRTGTFIDLDLDLDRIPATNDITFKKDDEAVKRSVRNLVLTNFWERPFHPEIGSGVYDLLFENMSPLVDRNIQRAIVEVISIFEPRAKVVKVETSMRDNGYEAKISFRILASDTLASISLFLEKTR